MTGLSVIHLIALIAGIIVILLIRRRYPEISTKEITVIIVLYIVLVFLFTEPLVNLINKFLT